MNFNMSSDASLWQLAVVGHNEDACRELLGRHHPFVRGVCNQLLLCADDVDEACQVTFLTLLENGDSIRSDDFSAWLYRVAWRASLRVRTDARRATPQAQKTLPEGTAADAFAQIEASERGHQVSAAVDKLPDRYRDVLILHYVNGLAREQVAQRLQISIQAVKGRLARGRDMLRSRLMKKGISLAAVAAVFSAQAEAEISDVQREVTWATVREWFNGTPVSIARIQLTDLTRKDFGMMTRNGLPSKLATAGLVAVALCIAFVVGRMAPAGGSGVTDSEPIDTYYSPSSTADFGPEVDAGPVDRAPVMLVSAQERPATTSPVEPITTTALEPAVPANPTIAPEPLFSPRVTQVSANTVQIVDAPRRGLPEGKWVRNSPMGKVTSDVTGKMISLTLSISQLPGATFTVKAEHSVASDGTIYGIVHGIDVDAPALSEELSELAVFAMMSDMPFLMRVHTDRDSVTIKNVTIGVPAASGEASDGIEIQQIARMIFGGTFRQEQ